MPPKAEVAIFEQDPGFMNEYRTSLEQAGHTVVAIATTGAELREIVPQLGALGVQVVLLDDFSVPYETWLERRIESQWGRTIRADNPNIRIVGVSHFGTQPPEEIHADMNKTRMLGDRVDMGQFVKDL